MYRHQMSEQLKLEVPFGVVLDANNRWIRLSAIMPWKKIDELYSANFKGTNGQVAKPSRLAFGALYIQSRLALTDEETVNQIWENPAMQYFCGFDMYNIEKPFDASLMVYFRKRISEEMLKEISEYAFIEEAKKAIQEEEGRDAKGNENDDADNDNEDNNKDGTDNSDNDNENEPKGTLLLDATCCPSDIHFPTDAGLLNHARELTEQMIDVLWKQFAGMNVLSFTKPRTYRNIARTDYMSFVKKRKSGYDDVRKALRGQLQYVRRNLDSIKKLLMRGADVSTLGEELQKKLETIKELYTQQKYMYDNETHSVENRIVSIAQPHIRPIVRGKAGAPVEFGAKVATARIGGFTFIIHTSYDNFSEGKYLIKTIEEYKRMFGFYPAVVIGDKAYTTRENRNYCKSKGIRLSCQKMGRKSEDEKEAERKQLYEDNCKRNAVEGDYGVVKRKYGLDLLMTKLYETTLTAISFGFFVKNMERILRLFVLRFFMSHGVLWQLNSMVA